jgi:outer membrane protein
MMPAALLLFLAQSRILTLDDALKTALHDQPTIRQAHANTEAALARVGEARAPLLPQLTGQASYARSTVNSAPCAAASFGVLSGCGTSVGGTGGPGMTAGSSWNPQSDAISANLTASQTLWDGTGQLARWRSFISTAEAQEANERATRLSVSLTLRQNYFAARANKALVEVARETLAGQDKHLAQTEGFVRVGTQPEIALATARTNRANALVQLITSENNYEIAKAQLNQTMGVERATDYDVADETLPPLPGEDAGIDALLDEALRNRPEFVSLDRQVQAQEQTIWAAKSTYGPTLTASTGITDRGTAVNANPFSNSFWNWSFNLQLNWNLFQGGLTWYTVKEQKANLAALEAQRDLLRQQTRLSVDQARLAVRSTKASLQAAIEAEVNAREQLRLAEGRFNAGVGNVIELTDAQVAMTSAAAQRVQAEYNLSSARAQLMQSLGRF